jgi:hypothetical protein
MNYHFVGDIMAGAGLGSITGMYAAHFFRLDALSEANRGQAGARPEQAAKHGQRLP